MTDPQPGVIVLLGSGETLPSSGKAHEFAARRLPPDPTIAILETPAGFELNAGQVAGKITEFLNSRLTNYNPNIIQIPARKRGTDLSPDDPELVAPLLEADEILLGPGSPTYAVRQLRDSLAYGYLQARHRLGAALVLSSAATLAFGRHTIPVYEIFKVGEDLHWKTGLDFFGQFGLPLSLVPHWNNNDGGDDLDTSRCYIGKPRFDELYQRLHKDEIILGIDDHTSVALDLAEGCCHVMGNGRVTVLRDGAELVFRSGDEFVLHQLGDFRLPPFGAGVPEDIWEKARRAAETRQSRRQAAEQPPEDVLALVADRTSAREAREWERADELRDRIEDHGWTVNDTPDGPEVVRLDQ